MDRIEKVLFCNKKGNPDWMEEFLTDNPDNFEKARAWAEANGYVVREANINLSTPPDFRKTVRRIK